MVELNNDANKNPQIKLKPGAIWSLQLFLQDQAGRELLEKNNQVHLGIMQKFKKGMFLQVWGTTARIAAEEPIQPRPTDFLEVLFSVRNELCYFKNTNDGITRLRFP